MKFDQIKPFLQWAILIGGLIAGWHFWVQHELGEKSKFGVSSQVKEIKLSFGNITKLPDPALIVTAGEWYLLNHVSSPLLAFDHEKGHFIPLLAESWTIQDNDYTFKLKSNLLFNDGTPILARDLASSIKRLLIKKTSSHFPIWEYLKGCSHLPSIDTECEGVQIIDDHTIRFRLTERRESFLLQMASPEGGIWSERDINHETAELSPKRFSGPYSIETSNLGEFTLHRNSRSEIQKNYPFSPERIVILPMSRAQIESGLLEGKLDLFIGDVIPFNKNKWETLPVQIHYTTPSSVLYLFKLSGECQSQLIGADVFEALWNSDRPKELYPADSFLPFGSIGAMNRVEFLHQLPPKSEKRAIQIAIPNVYFQQGFIEFLKKRAFGVGLSLEFTRLPVDQYFELLEGKENSKFDFALSGYVASERYPAVQLRYMLSGKSFPKGFDLPSVDSPETSEERFKAIARLEKELVARQIVLPLYFVRTHIIAKKQLDLGNQPVSDADIQLWRIKSK